MPLSVTCPNLKWYHCGNIVNGAKTVSVSQCITWGGSDTWLSGATKAWGHQIPTIYFFKKLPLKSDPSLQIKNESLAT